MSAAEIKMATTQAVTIGWLPRASSDGTQEPEQGEMSDDGDADEHENGLVLALFEDSLQVHGASSGWWLEKLGQRIKNDLSGGLD